MGRVEKEMKPKIIPILEICVEVGLMLGYNRAHKHQLDPSEEDVRRHQADAIMNEIFERFDFEEIK
jgi:hypothetical protein